MKFDDFIKQEKIEINKIDIKVTKVKEKQDNVLLYLDNDEKINISVENYFRYNIQNNKGLDNDSYEKLKKEEVVLLAYKRVLFRLSKKDYTVKQIKDYLKNKQLLDDSDINTIIDKLHNYGLLDDDKYCLNRINYLSKDNLSNKQIEVKLLKEGISKEIINKYVVYSYEVELNKCKKLCEKYDRTIKNKASKLKKQTILNKLVNNGYSIDIAKEAINSLDIIVDNEYELLKREYARALLKYSKKYKDYELKNKIYAYLLAKGFSASMIKELENE